jgi:hypothetical protein
VSCFVEDQGQAQAQRDRCGQEGGSQAGSQARPEGGGARPAGDTEGGEEAPRETRPSAVAGEARHQAERAGRSAASPTSPTRAPRACRKSLRLFCETYNPEAFYLGWSDDHLRAIDRIEEAATLGALFAFAMARGSGKTTICRHGRAVGHAQRDLPVRRS